MTNRDLLKEAIADAKAVKEVAITNAKAALEEAFTPHLKEMFEKKMKDMEDEEEMNEYAETQPDRDMDGDGDVDAEDAKAMSESELEELLRELDEAEEEESEEPEEEEGEEEEGDEDEVEIDLEEMTEEDLKKFIEEVVDEMIEAGELEAGHEGMEDEAGMEMEPEMDAEEAPAEEEAPMMEMKDSENLSEIIDLSPDQIAMLPGLVATTLGGLVGGGALLAYKDEIMAAVKKSISKVAGEGSKETTEASHKKDDSMKHMEEELAEAIDTITTLKSELNEINLLNSKLLYTNKIFKAKNLTEAQKVKVLTAFDKAETVKEVKLVFETLNEGLEKAAKKELVRESKGFASKVIGSSPKQPVVEVNPVFERMKKLAGL